MVGSNSGVVVSPLLCLTEDPRFDSLPSGRKVVGPMGTKVHPVSRNGYLGISMTKQRRQLQMVVFMTHGGGGGGGLPKNVKAQRLCTPDAIGRLKIPFLILQLIREVMYKKDIYKNLCTICT